MCSLWISWSYSFRVAHLGTNEKILEDYIPTNHSWWLLERYTHCTLASIFRVVTSVFTHVCLCVEAIGGISCLKVTVCSVTATFYHLGSLLGVIQSLIWFVYVLIMTQSGILHCYERSTRMFTWQKMSLESPFFRVNANNLKQQTNLNICAQTVFSVAHTEHTLPLAKAHRQRPTNTFCTFSHIQTKTHKTQTQRPAFCSIFLILVFANSDTQRS